MNDETRRLTRGVKILPFAWDSGQNIKLLALFSTFFSQYLPEQFNLKIQEDDPCKKSL
jgi:hypothetical protein